MRVIWSDQALIDVGRIATYITEYNPQAALRTVDALIEAGDSLSTFPHRFRQGRGGTREVTIIHPYVIVYRVDEALDEVMILRVWHGAQRR